MTCFYFATPISRRYLSTPGWISATSGAAATGLAAVVSQACELLAECRLHIVQRARESIGDVVGQVLAREDEAP